MDWLLLHLLSSNHKVLTLSLIRQFCSRRLRTYFVKNRKFYNWMDNLWLKVENIVAKGEIAHFDQFLLLSLCFQKAVCCRGVRKRLYEGKGFMMQCRWRPWCTYMYSWLLLTRTCDYSNIICTAVLQQTTLKTFKQKREQSS